MILFTLISRVFDGLPLADDTGCDGALPEELRATASAVCKQLAVDPRIARDNPALIVCDPPYIFYILVRSGLVCLAVCDNSASQAAAFAYLHEVCLEFGQQYGFLVKGAARPFCFLEFDVRLQQTKLVFSSSSTTTRMPRSMASMPAPRRLPMGEFLLNRSSGRGSGSRRGSKHSSPTAYDAIKAMPLLFPAESSDELVRDGGTGAAKRDEIQRLLSEQWQLITAVVCAILVAIVTLFLLLSCLSQ